MLKKNSLSDFEWSIMRLIWKNPQISVKDVHIQLTGNNERAYTTVQTYMERLVDKKFLTKQKDGKVNFYYPMIEENDMLEKETNSFVKKAFKGSFSNLAAFLFDMDTINEDDLNKLKKLIKDKEE